MTDHALDDAVEEGVVAYALEMNAGTTHKDAMPVSIRAALLSRENAIRKEISEFAIAVAEDLDRNDSAELAQDGVAALLWLARELQEEVPMDDR